RPRAPGRSRISWESHATRTCLLALETRPVPRGPAAALPGRGPWSAAARAGLADQRDHQLRGLVQAAGRDVVVPVDPAAGHAVPGRRVRQPARRGCQVRGRRLTWPAGPRTSVAAGPQLSRPAASQPPVVSRSSTTAAASWRDMADVSMTRSASVGSSYGSETPVRLSFRPARALV